MHCKLCLLELRKQVMMIWSLILQPQFQGWSINLHKKNKITPSRVITGSGKKTQFKALLAIGAVQECI